MKAVFRFGAMIGVFAALTAMSMAQHPGRNSFLNESVRTTDQLIAEVKSDPDIRDSYERHFQMSEDQLYTYLRTLHPMRLEHDDIFTIYSIPPGGELKAHTQRLHKGELVFVDMNGKPILRARCGNPLVGAPPGVIPEESVTGGPSAMVPMTVPQAELVPTIPLSLQPAPPTVPEVAVVPPTITPVVTTTASQRLPLLPLLALPIIGGSTHGGGGGGVVPEPMTMAALALGAGTLMAKRRGKK
jgi:hypothetical protein